MPNTPSQRTTRSNSNTTNFTLQDIKTLIDNSKAEILKALTSEIDKLHALVGSLATRVEDLRRQNANIEARCQALEDSKSENSVQQSKQTELIIRESQERHRRRKYLIVTGLPDNSTGDVEERRIRDETAIRDLCNELGLDEIRLDEIRRIGRIDDTRPRLLRVKCKDFESKMTILKKSKSLRSIHKYQNVFINPDRTFLEREQLKQLRSELRSRREAGEEVMIRHGQVIDISKEKDFQ